METEYDFNEREREYEPFLKQENINMLFDIILEAELIPNGNQRDLRENVFNEMIHFFKREKTTGKSLIHLNKEFINSLIAEKKPRQQIQHVKVEDIQLERLSSFQKNLDRKKTEFQDAVNLKIPETPNFSDDMDKPITEIESLISKTIMERNFEIEKIHQNVNKSKVQQFLKSQETSVKKPPPDNLNPNIKFIKIEKTDIKPETVSLNVIDLPEYNE